jgi:hypothetical protein
MSTAASAGMQAALLIREKQRLRRKKLRKGRAELPSHIATREIAPFPQYPPGFMVGPPTNIKEETNEQISTLPATPTHKLAF